MDFTVLIPVIRRLALEAGDRILQVYNGCLLYTSRCV